MPLPLVPDTAGIHDFPAWLPFHRGPAVIPGFPGSHDQTHGTVEPIFVIFEFTEPQLPTIYLLRVFRDVCLRCPRDLWEVVKFWGLGQVAVLPSHSQIKKKKIKSQWWVFFFLRTYTD